MQNPKFFGVLSIPCSKKWGASLDADAHGLRSSTDGSAQDSALVLQHQTWCSHITKKTLDTTNPQKKMTHRTLINIHTELNPKIVEKQYVQSCSHRIVSCDACRASKPMRHPAGTTLAVGFLFSAVVAGNSPYDEYFTQSPLVQTASL